MPRNKHPRNLALRRRNGDLIGWVARTEAFQLFNEGQAEWIDPDDIRKGMRRVNGYLATSHQGKVLESLAIEKFPQVVNGGLARTETQPIDRKHLPRLRQWFNPAS